MKSLTTRQERIMERYNDDKLILHYIKTKQLTVAGYAKDGKWFYPVFSFNNKPCTIVLSSNMIYISPRQWSLTRIVYLFYKGRIKKNYIISRVSDNYADYTPENLTAVNHTYINKKSYDIGNLVHINSGKKISDIEVQQIRDLRKQFLTYAQIKEQLSLNISVRHIGNICNNIWRRKVC